MSFSTGVVPGSGGDKESGMTLACRYPSARLALKVRELTCDSARFAALSALSSRRIPPVTSCRPLQLCRPCIVITHMGQRTVGTCPIARPDCIPSNEVGQMLAALVALQTVMHDEALF